MQRIKLKTLEMNKEEFENKAEELFLKYSYQAEHGGDLVIGENAFNYLTEQLHEALLNRLEAESKEDLKTCDVCGSESTITVSNKGENCDWCNPL